MSDDPPKPPRPDYDMEDWDDELPPPGRLADALVYCRELLLPLYYAANRGAMKDQKTYRIISAVAVSCGTVAVLFAIVQLSGLLRAPWPLWTEVFAALSAVVAVVLGLMLSKQSAWLLQRNKAERFRLLKFGSIIDPRLWCKSGEASENAEAWRARLHSSAEQIESMTPADLERGDRGDRTDSSVELKDCLLDDDEIRRLIDYYRDRRLNTQMYFFRTRAGDNNKYDRLLKKVGPAFFFLSVAAVFAHLVVDIACGHGLHSTSVALIAIAAILPVLGSGVRNFRGVYEFVRNARLFSRMRDSLRRQRDELDEMRKDPGYWPPGRTRAEAVLELMKRCEQSMENEHSEWMRLMLEAEWYS